MSCFIEINKVHVIRSFSAYKIHRRTIGMYHNCDTTNFPWVVVVVGGGIRELEYLIIYYEKKYLFLSSTKSHTYVPCGTGAWNFHDGNWNSFGQKKPLSANFFFRRSKTFWSYVVKRIFGTNIIHHDVMDITFFIEIVPSYKLSIIRHFFSVYSPVSTINKIVFNVCVHYLLHII